MSSNGKCWETSDLYLAAALCCRGHNLLDIRRVGPKAVFVFQHSRHLTQDIRAFFTHQLQVEALGYAAAIRNTKAAIFNTLR